MGLDSEVAVCNKALLLIGQPQIISLDEDSKAARHCNALYGQARDAVERAHPWNCCDARASLARLEDPPEFGYAYQYQLPTKPYCLRALHMENREHKFKVSGRKLLTDEGTCNLVFIARVEDVTQMDALLKEAIAARLASELAYPIARSNQLTTTRWEIYERVLAEARSIDGQEGTPEQFEGETWLDARG